MNHHQLTAYVQQYKYLGCCVNNQLDYNQEIEAKIELARQGFIKIACSVTSASISILGVYVAMCCQYYFMEQRRGPSTYHLLRN